MAVKMKCTVAQIKAVLKKDAPGKKEKRKSYEILIQAGERLPFSLIEPSCFNRFLTADYDILFGSEASSFSTLVIPSTVITL